MNNTAITALATYRVTKLLIEDEITEPVRSRIQEKFPPESTKIGYLTTCPWCVSVWVALPVYFLPKSVKTALAASAVTGLVSERIG